MAASLEQVKTHIADMEARLLTHARSKHKLHVQTVKHSLFLISKGLEGLRRQFGHHGLTSRKGWRRRRRGVTPAPNERMSSARWTDRSGAGGCSRSSRAVCASVRAARVIAHKRRTRCAPAESDHWSISLAFTSGCVGVRPNEEIKRVQPRRGLWWSVF